jgi:hypothetical protein
MWWRYMEETEKEEKGKRKNSTIFISPASIFKL